MKTHNPPNHEADHMCTTDYISPEETSRFLKLLDPVNNRFTFQTFDDNQDRKSANLARILHGTLKEHSPTLRVLSQQGAGVFVTVNETDFKGRKLENITMSRALWQEDDGDGKELPLTPNFITESSPGHFHRYILTDCSLNQHMSYQKALVKDFGSDPAAKDISRVLRLPGFPHQKVNAKKKLTGEKFMVRIAEVNHEQVMSHSELQEVFDTTDVIENIGPSTGDFHCTDDLLAAIRAALTHISSDDRAVWVQVGMSLRTLDHVAAYETFRQWSSDSKKYDENTIQKDWDGFDPTRTGPSNIFFIAQANGMDAEDVDLGLAMIERIENPLPPIPAHLKPTGSDTKPEGAKLKRGEDIFSQFELSKEEIDEMADAEWVYEKLFVRGHIILLPADPNAGKTAICFDIAKKIARDNKVIYVHADASGGDVKRMHPQARAAGVRLLTPDFKLEQSMESVLKVFDRLVMDGERLDDMVVFFDTLKKMTTDVINKKLNSALFKRLRKIVALGATVVLLAHNNKRLEANGEIMYEGTGDMKADVDELIFLVDVKDPNTGMRTITSYPDKVRAFDFDSLSFTIDEQMNLTYLDYVVDTKKMAALQEAVKKDKDIILQIDIAIASECTLQKEIIERVKENSGLTVTPIRRVLAKYSEVANGQAVDPAVPFRSQGIYWFIGRGDNNSMHYTITDGAMD